MRAITLAALAAAFAIMPAFARAAVVTYEGTTTDGEAMDVLIETTGPDPIIFANVWTIDVTLSDGVDTFTLSETIYDSLFGVIPTPYDVTFDAAAGLITFDGAAGLGPNDLTSLTLRYAVPFTGTPTVDAVLAYVASAQLIGLDAEVGGLAFSVAIAPEAVPLPGAAFLFMAGLAVLSAGRRTADHSA